MFSGENYCTSITAMAPLKFVIKCGNFAVLVDLHVLPLGSHEDASWFTPSHIEEVTTLVRDAVDQRVKQYAESFQKGRQPKNKKELAPASAFIAKELHVFPERYVVCVSLPEDAAVYYTKPSSTATELSQQSRSEYFSREGEIQESFNCAAKIKKTALQKIAQKAHVQQEHRDPIVGERQSEQRVCVESGTCDASAPLDSEQQVPCSSSVTQNQALTHQRKTDHCSPDNMKPNLVSVVLCRREISPGSRRSKRSKPSDSEDPRPLKAKRTGLDRPPAATQTRSNERLTQTSEHDPLPPDAESKAFPLSDYKKTTVEVELLTPGKRDQRLPLASNNTAQTKQNRPAASRRGLSVKLASSAASISSRSAGGEEASENVPRISRLRRPKRS
ncbi:protein SLX4IP isoform X3 [Vanacampus margaritifer]